MEWNASSPSSPGRGPMTSTASTPTRWTGVLKRWPTALALALAGLSMTDGDAVSTTVESYGELLPYLALLYLVVAKLRRRALSWPVLFLGGALLVAVSTVDVVSPSLATTGIALVALAWSATGGDLRTSAVLRAQALGVIGFGALALVGLALDPDVGRYVVAAGWFLHGIWDLVHLRLDRVVSRSYAEACAVFDILVAVGLAFIV